MNREIKFRAWNGNSMYEVRSLHNLHSQVNVHADLCDKDGGLGTDKPVVMTAYNLQLMQYTGLKDKNGVDIYEGDIVELSDEFDEEGVFAIEWQINGFWLGGWDGNEYGFPDGSSLQVIGNIHKNPELLEAHS